MTPVGRRTSLCNSGLRAGYAVPASSGKWEDPAYVDLTHGSTSGLSPSLSLSLSLSPLLYPYMSYECMYNINKRFVHVLTSYIYIYMCIYIYIYIYMQFRRVPTVLEIVVFSRTLGSVSIARAGACIGSGLLELAQSPQSWIACSFCLIRKHVVKGRLNMGQNLNAKCLVYPRAPD